MKSKIIIQLVITSLLFSPFFSPTAQAEIPPTLQWNQIYSEGSYGVSPSDMVIDTSDNIIVATYNWPSQSDDHNHQSWVLKYDSSGNLLWNQNYDNGFGPSEVASDDNGNIIVTGNGWDAYNWTTYGWIWKYDSAGNLLWNYTYELGSYAQKVVLDNSNNIIVVGKNSSNPWIRKYDSTGNLLWFQTYNSNNPNPQNNFWAATVALDSFDNIIVAGSISDGTNLILKYDSTGNLLWQQTSNTGGLENLYGAVIDGSDSIVVIGNTSIADSNISYGWINKYDSAGNLLWNQSLVGDATFNEYINKIVLDNNNIIIIGSASDKTNPDPYPYNGYTWIRKYDSVGSLLWNQTYNTTGDDWAENIMLGRNGDLIILGSTFYDSSSENWMLKYDNAGNQIWNMIYDNNNGWASKIALDSTDNVIIAGSTSTGNYTGYTWISKYGNAACLPDGDVNQDGGITPNDALQTFQHYLGIVTLDECGQGHADVSQDSFITPADSLCIFQKYLGLPSCLD